MVTLTGANPDLWGVIGDLIVKNMDWPGAEEMAERIRKTIPPNLIEQPEEGDPEAQKAQLQQAAQALGQREAELNALAEQMQAGMAEAQKADSEAKSAKAAADGATAKAQAKVDEINMELQSLKSARELFAMQQKLAAKELEMERSTLKSEKDVLNAEVNVIKANLEKRLSEIQNEATVANTRDSSVHESTSGLVEQLMKEIQGVRELATAERELIYDDMGEPVGSRIVQAT
jgi:DNA repair exonuclease SbcCD ATPase subunit